MPSMSVVRALAPVLVLALLGSGCGGGSDTTETTDLRRAYALEYAASARRAIDGTRYEAMSDSDLADLIVATCTEMAESNDPDATVLAAAAGVDAPEGEPVDDEILVIVLAEGIAAVCPDETEAAFVRGEAEGDPEDAFMAVARPAASGSGIDDGLLLAAGARVCSVLDDAGSPEEAILEEISLLFGVEGAGVAALSESGALTEAQGLLAGTILGAAASLLCPAHRDLVSTYVMVLEP